MTFQQFGEKIQTYYGGIYNPVMREEVANLLKGLDLDGDKLDQLWRVIIENISSRYKSLPDVADILALMPKWVERLNIESTLSRVKQIEPNNIEALE